MLAVRRRGDRRTRFDPTVRSGGHHARPLEDDLEAGVEERGEADWRPSQGGPRAAVGAHGRQIRPRKRHAADPPTLAAVLPTESGRIEESGMRNLMNSSRAQILTGISLSSRKQECHVESQLETENSKARIHHHQRTVERGVWVWVVWQWWREGHTREETSATAGQCNSAPPEVLRSRKASIWQAWHTGGDFVCCRFVSGSEARQGWLTGHRTTLTWCSQSACCTVHVTSRASPSLRLAMPPEHQSLALMNLFIVPEPPSPLSFPLSLSLSLSLPLSL